MLLGFSPAQAFKGHGIDRHLLGLKLQAIEEGYSIPKVFMDTAYGVATHWKLRTGQVCVFGTFGPRFAPFPASRSATACVEVSTSTDYFSQRHLVGGGAHIISDGPADHRTFKRLNVCFRGSLGRLSGGLPVKKVVF